jgi:hypothetical protein
MAADRTKPKKNWGCFPYFVAFVLALGTITLYPMVTHPPVDYLLLLLKLSTFALLLLIWSPWFNNIRQWHPTVVLLPYLGFMLQAIYPIMSQHSVDYFTLLTTISTYTLLALPSSPWYRYMQQRHTLALPIFIGLTFFLGFLPFMLHPRPDYFGIFWLIVGIIAFLFILYFLGKRRPEASTTTTQLQEEPTTQGEYIASSMNEEPTSEFTIFGIHLKVYRRRKSMRIDF